MFNCSIFSYRRACLLIIALSLSASSAIGQTGVLELGTPVAVGETIRVPIQLGGDVGNGVSAMDFRLNYDPAVFEPVEVSAGAALQAAGKLVEANVARPGEYAVLIFGMNQSGVTGGEVAQIALRVLDKPPSEGSELAITNTTLSLANAQRLPSRGSTRTVSFDGQTPSEPVDVPAPTGPLPALPGSDDEDETPATAAPLLGGGVTADNGSNRPGQPLEVVAKLVDKLREAEALRSGLPAGGRGEAGPATGAPSEGDTLEETREAPQMEAITPVQETAALSDEPAASAEPPTVATPDKRPAEPGAAATDERPKKVLVGFTILAVAVLGILWGIRTVLVR